MPTSWNAMKPDAPSRPLCACAKPTNTRFAKRAVIRFTRPGNGVRLDQHEWPPHEDCGDRRRALRRSHRRTRRRPHRNGGDGPAGAADLPHGCRAHPGPDAIGPSSHHLPARQREQLEAGVGDELGLEPTLRADEQNGVAALARSPQPRASAGVTCPPVPPPAITQLSAMTRAPPAVASARSDGRRRFARRRAGAPARRSRRSSEVLP